MDPDIVVLHRHITDAISSCIPTTNTKIGIAFSGGVDSSVVAKLCSDMGYNITLLTIGFSQSPDILFAKKVNLLYGFTHHILEIDDVSFQKVQPQIIHRMKTNNLSWNENGIAFYYICKLAQKLGINTVVTANGIDELFCGYNAYRNFDDNNKFDFIMDMMNKKLENESQMFEAINHAVSEFGVCVLQPLLSADFITYAKTIPIDQKIIDKDDLLRKHIIRRLASQCGVPEIAYKKRKKALQYGSKIHKAWLKSR